MTNFAPRIVENFTMRTALYSEKCDGARGWWFLTVSLCFLVEMQWWVAFFGLLKIVMPAAVMKSPKFSFRKNEILLFLISLSIFKSALFHCSKCNFFRGRWLCRPPANMNILSLCRRISCRVFSNPLRFHRKAACLSGNFRRLRMKLRRKTHPDQRLIHRLHRTEYPRPVLFKTNADFHRDTAF